MIHEKIKQKQPSCRFIWLLGAKKSFLLLLGICLFLGNKQLMAQSPSLYFDIRNEVRIDSIYSFDVFMHADSSGTYHNRGQIFILYDTAAFGTAIVLRSKVNSRHLDLLDDSLLLPPSGPRVALYQTILNDNANRIAATWLSNFSTMCPASSLTHALVDTIPKGLYHFDVVMKDTTVSPQLAIDYSIMLGQHFYVNPNPPSSGVNCEILYGLGLPQSCSFSINLGPDTAICPGTSLLLGASYPNSSYLWSNNTTNSSLLITTPGTYWLEVDSSGCVSRDTIKISYNTPAFSLINAFPQKGAMPLTVGIVVDSFCFSGTAKLNFGAGSRIPLITLNPQTLPDTFYYTYTEFAVYHPFIEVNGIKIALTNVHVQSCNWAGFIRKSGGVRLPNLDVCDFVQDTVAYIPPSFANGGGYWSHFRNIRDLPVDGDSLRVRIRIKNPSSSGGQSAYDLGFGVRCEYGVGAVNYIGHTVGSSGASPFNYLAATSLNTYRIGNVDSLNQNFSDWSIVELELIGDSLFTYFDGRKMAGVPKDRGYGKYGGITLSFKGSGLLDWVEVVDLRNGQNTVAYREDFNSCQTLMEDFSIDLGPDSISCDSLLIQSPLGFDNYLWNTGSSTSDLTIFNSGIYDVQIDSAGCRAFDTVSVTINNVPAPGVVSPIVYTVGDPASPLTATGINLKWFPIAFGGPDLGFTPIPGTAVADTFSFWVSQTINGCESPRAEIEIQISGNALLCPPIDTQTIHLRKGWSMISSYLCLSDADLDSIFQAIQSEVWILKDEAGQAFIPGMVNTIGSWQGTKGYQIKTYQDTVLQLMGQKQNPSQTELVLPAGWSIISYLRDSAMAINPALGADIVNNLYVLKNQDGRVFVPSFGIDQIGNMEPGQGYWIRMISNDTLIYPSRRGYYASITVPELQGEHFPHLTHNGSNATLIFPLDEWQDMLQIGDEIGVFSQDGMLVGSAVFNGGSLAMAIWEDDPSTQQREGLISGDSFILKKWDTRLSQESFLFVQSKEGELSYGTNKILILSPSRQAEAVYMIKWFPNPAEDRVNIDFSFSSEQTVLVELFDIKGRLVFEKTQELSEGDDRMSLNISKLASGVYTWRVRWNDQVERGKLMLNGR